MPSSPCVRRGPHGGLFQLVGLLGLVGSSCGGPQASAGPLGAPSTDPGSDAIGPGAELTARDEGGALLRFRVDSVDADPDDPEGELLLYALSVWDAESGAWGPYCAPNPAGDRRAIPLAGSWDARGAHVDRGDGALTFACTAGVLAKCVRWGYRPWKTVRGASLAPLHQACTRMARADYCGDGRSYTREGTTIDVYDTLGVQAPARLAGFSLEAGWDEHGATFVNHARWFDPLAEVAAACAERLDARTSVAEGRSLTADEIRARWPSTLLFNDSLDRQGAQSPTSPPGVGP